MFFIIHAQTIIVGSQADVLDYATTHGLPVGEIQRAAKGQLKELASWADAVMYI